MTRSHWTSDSTSHCVRSSLIAAAAVTALALANAAHAVTIETVPIGNPGNLPDTEVMLLDGTTGYGSVPYSYRIGKYEVTNAQYAEFLNAKAASDPFELYVDDDGTGMGGPRGGISRSGADGSYSYTAKPGMGNKPVNYVGVFNSVRFINWLQNGQGNGDTETGAYTLGNEPITRNPGATVFLPTENEWYKAAYHKNDGITGNYFNSPSSSDLQPIGEAPPGGSNSENGNGILTTFTDVGAYTGSASPYGTFDQGGNVWEWLEGFSSSANYVARGGSFGTHLGVPMANFRYIYAFGSYGSLDQGFRVATVAALPDLPGDFNHDGTVNAADYVVWRKTGGSPTEYNDWRTHYGQTAFSGSSGYPLGASAGSLSAAVPEPTSLVLVMCGLFVIIASYRRVPTTSRLLQAKSVIAVLSLVVARNQSGAPNDSLLENRRVKLLTKTLCGPLWAASVAALILVARPARADDGFHVLHSFNNTASYDDPNIEGFDSRAPLVLLGSKLYGTTFEGGSETGGTVFSMNLDGSEYQTLYSFQYGYGNGTSGYASLAGLTPAGSKLYGTTLEGGQYNGGTLFSMNLDGSEYQVLRSFDSTGYYPHAALTVVGSELYGTASSGILFSLNLDGTNYKVLHKFIGNSFNQGDGATPRAELTLEGSKLYGTTNSGGPQSGGTVFSINLDGSGYEILHSFDTRSKDAIPAAPHKVAILGSTLYGTTSQDDAWGTVFSMNLDGSGYQILHVFGPDGSNPDAGVTLVGSKLYGTTGIEPGKIFCMNLDGSDYQILHSFSDLINSSPPYAEMTLVGSTLYGTTSGGGTGGGGVVFAITVPEPPTVLLAALGIFTVMGFYHQKHRPCQHAAPFKPFGAQFSHSLMRRAKQCES